MDDPRRWFAICLGTALSFGVAASYRTPDPVLVSCPTLRLTHDARPEAIVVLVDGMPAQEVATRDVIAGRASFLAPWPSGQATIVGGARVRDATVRFEPSADGAVCTTDGWITPTPEWKWVEVHGHVTGAACDALVVRACDMRAPVDSEGRYMMGMPGRACGLQVGRKTGPTVRWGPVRHPQIPHDGRVDLDAPGRGSVGIGLRWDDHGARVGYVRAGGGADVAGIRVGQRIVAIDGSPPIQGVSYTGSPGTVIALTVADGDRTQVFRIERDTADVPAPAR